MPQQKITEKSWKYKGKDTWNSWTGGICLQTFLTSDVAGNQKLLTGRSKYALNMRVTLRTTLFVARKEQRSEHACIYLGSPSTTKEMDKRLSRIKPPQEFRRTPRSVTSFKQWKASEFRAWLLYYALLVLSDLLPADYIYHLSLFVSAMHILLSDTISLEDIELAHNLLSAFYELATQLYPVKIFTMNLHILIHFSKFVRSWGPLWCYSCFGFESMNGHLRKNCHGTKLVLTQLIHNVRMQQLLPMKSKKVISSATPVVASFLESLADVTRDAPSRTEVKSRITRKKSHRNCGKRLAFSQFHWQHSSLTCSYLCVSGFDTIQYCILLQMVKIECGTDLFVSTSTKVHCTLAPYFNFSLLSAN